MEIDEPDVNNIASIVSRVPRTEHVRDLGFAVSGSDVVALSLSESVANFESETFSPSPKLRN